MQQHIRYRRATFEEICGSSHTTLATAGDNDNAYDMNLDGNGVSTDGMADPDVVGECEHVDVCGGRVLRSVWTFLKFVSKLHVNMCVSIERVNES